MPNSTKFGISHPWVKGIQVCSNEGSFPFPRGDNYKLVKNTLMKFKIHLLRNQWVNFNQILHKASLGEGCISLFNEGPHIFPRVDNYKIAKN